MTSMSEHDRRWTFVTNHTRVLAYIATDPHARLRDIADAVGITERTATQIVNDLEQGGYLTKTRNGRRNQYAIDGRTKLRHSNLKGLTPSQVIALVLDVLDRQPFS